MSVDVNGFSASSAEASTIDTSSTDAGAFAASPTEQPTGQVAESTPALGETAEPDDSALPFGTHPRFQQLIEQNREYREYKEDALLARAYKPFLEKMQEAGFTDHAAFEAAMSARQAEAAQQQQQEEYQNQQHQDIADQLETERAGIEAGLIERYGFADPDDVDQMLKARSHELAYEAAGKIQQYQAKVQAVAEARQVINSLPEKFRGAALEIASAFGAKDVPEVTAFLKDLRETIKSETITEYEALRAKDETTAPLNGVGGTEAVTPKYEATGNLGHLFAIAAGAHRV